MATEQFIDDITTILRRAEEAAYKRGYERGQADKAKEIMAVLGHAPSPDETSEQQAPSVVVGDTVSAEVRPASERKRAPKGLVPKFVKRVLAENPGLTPKEILERASNEFERMIKAASVRSELRKDGYHSRDGRWFLVSSEAEDQSGQEQSSASEFNQEGSDDAAALI